ncbi:MAG: MaoC family dehydratase N-terminal domain-containing protein [Actinomycetota bacterium]|nr:MaoC family dehydratase N-terminal domain-containing protein [Actinomycetota bacterium]
MSLNPEFVGRVYPPAAIYVVGREKIREFAAAVGEANPACTDVAAARALGYPDLVAPPTFGIVLSMRASRAVIFDPDLGLDYTRVVHGEQRFSFIRPIVAGDELLVATTIESIRSMAGNDMIMTRGDVGTASGEAVLTTYSLLVARGPDEDAP